MWTISLTLTLTPERRVLIPVTKSRRFDRDVNGILLFDKPVGMTSNAALQQARALFRAEKAGHAGSLDPMASGMLPICFGQATKVCAFLLDANKTYRFTARLGERTDTGDADGVVVERASVPHLTKDQIRRVLDANLGEQQQIPPMYSALKRNGERLYELARRGEEVERAPRRILIEALELMRFDAECLELVVRCSKGTYVRVLAEDIGRQLGTVAHLTALRRLQVDPFAEPAMRSLEQLTELAKVGLPALDSELIAADRALLHFSALKFDQSGQDALLQGKAVLCSQAMSDESVRLYGPNDVFLGVGQATCNGTVQPRRIFHNLSIKP
jgi:tRNA pseudouridine55 synthase